MCELSTQAYDMAEYANERCYQFPANIRVAVADHEEKNHQHGTGCLVIYDMARIDLPQPIRTQDFATVYPNQSFRLHGRLVGAPIKGCSLTALD